MTVNPGPATRPCPHCGDQIAVSATQCPSCAEQVSPLVVGQPVAGPLAPGPAATQGAQEKAGGTAVLLDFILPGAGHLYGSAGKRGTAILVVNIICGIITSLLFAAQPPLAIPTFLVQIVLWIVGIRSTSRVLTDDARAATS